MFACQPRLAIYDFSISTTNKSVPTDYFSFFWIPQHKLSASAATINVEFIKVASLACSPTCIAECKFSQPSYFSKSVGRRKIVDNVQFIARFIRLSKQTRVFQLDLYQIRIYLFYQWSHANFSLINYSIFPVSLELFRLQAYLEENRNR